MITALWERLEGRPWAADDARWAWLTPDETARAGRFGHARRRDQFLAGHSLLRLAAARLLNRDPAALALNVEGAPACLNDSGPVWLSLSHSGPFVVAVASDRGPVGVDVEQRDQRRDWAGLAAGLGWTGDDAADLDGFLRRWTLREACLKAGLEQAEASWQAVTSTAVISVVALPFSPLQWLSPHPFDAALKATAFAS